MRLKKRSYRHRPNTAGHVQDVRFIEVETAQAAPVRQMVIELGGGVSDIKNVAYLYTFRVYEKFVELGELHE